MVELMKKNGASFNEYFFKRTQKAVNNDLSEVHLFNVGSAEYQVVLEQTNYPEAIHQLEQYFIKTEQYERVKDCKQLLDKHNINLLIRRSTIQ